MSSLSCDALPGRARHEQRATFPGGRKTMLLLSAVLSTVLNLLVFAGLPFLLYFAYQKVRHRRTLREVTQRAGLRLGALRYLATSLAVALAGVAALALWPPSLTPLLRPGSPQRVFNGLGLTPDAVLMALLYGVLKTGFSEEFLFRGLITGSLARRLPLAWANLLQALIFLVPHVFAVAVMPELWGLLPLVFLGALFVGWIRIKSDSMVGPWITHACLNVTICLSVALRTST